VELLRLAELLSGLSMVADIGMGLEPGEAGRASLVAIALTDLLPDADASHVYYTTLLQHVGCTAYAHEAAAALGGDEIAVKRAAVHTDFGDPRDVLRTYLPHLAPSAGAITRLRAAGTAALRGRQIVLGYSRANCEVAARTAARLGLPAAVQDALLSIYEQWNGKGGPQSTAGEAIPLPARIAQVAITATLFDSVGGRDAAVVAVRRRAGAALDPGLSELLCSQAQRVLGVLDVADPLVASVQAEPEPVVRVSELGLDRVCRAFGEAVDLKTPLHHGHSTGVARLAETAAGRRGLDARAVDDVRRAGFLHDLGRAAVRNGVWERPGPLSWTEQEQVRLHPHYSERVIARCGPLAALAPIAGAHHERLDGSGYHRQLTAAGLDACARLLAAADVFQAMTQPRAHRPAHPPEQAAALIAAEARAGRLDADAVSAVLDAAGHSRPRVRASYPAGLTDRQVEVLRLLAKGLSNPQIAKQLVISRRTAERHVQDLYARIGVSSRAAAALFAMEHDLLQDG
jgi:HD-GYP domain-containing protein (c-di-GMP phosphodiesterase class II)